MLLANSPSLIHHPDTPACQAAFARQSQEWARKWGDKPVTYEKPVPLTLGTAPIRSGECYKCAEFGHCALDCPKPKEQWVRKREGRWRWLCGLELQGQTASVNAVIDIELQEMLGGYVEESGKEEGSSD